MKGILCVLISVFLLQSCTNEESIRDKFNNLKSIDYSKFKGISIENRKGSYLITYEGSQHLIKRNIFSKKIPSIEKAFREEGQSLLPEKDIDRIENALKSFNKMGILMLSVDEKENLFLSVPWNDRCTYYFLKLSATSTLKELEKQYYQNYENNWYLYKECAEK